MSTAKPEHFKLNYCILLCKCRRDRRKLIMALKFFAFTFTDLEIGNICTFLNSSKTKSFIKFQQGEWCIEGRWLDKILSKTGPVVSSYIELCSMIFTQVLIFCYRPNCLSWSNERICNFWLVVDCWNRRKIESFFSIYLELCLSSV